MVVEGGTYVKLLQIAWCQCSHILLILFASAVKQVVALVKVKTVSVVVVVSILITTITISMENLLLVRWLSVGGRVWMEVVQVPLCVMKGQRTFYHLQSLVDFPVTG
jgi:hypothetical protein